MNSSILIAIALAVILLVLLFYFVSAKGEKRRITLINSEGKRIDINVEIADNMTTRMKGLMNRSSLGEYEGMLFVFDKPSVYAFWMLNTTIPLDAIHIAQNGTIVDIIEMEPCGFNVTNCRIYTPKAAALYVLEANKGFSIKNKLEIGKSSLDMDTLGVSFSKSGSE